ncbi:helix-turn-helix transcriptional regulator [Sphingomonas sp.]|uniref:helix-turn-helix domain-containing protein n=1 Tax=Sphingomonas sp. TaxID=28214 RepID=UPI001D563F65|nr:helix-turn-helix transcriptional regulator [Sphingomonas sp.]MBX9796734.1 helix-turn-helix domain-containing protein [Sphingomonas sp.]
MITAIRDVRRARGMTLDDVARACVPPTTAQTIGRLETGTRTVSVAWLNRIAAALGVEATELVRLSDEGVPVAALLGPDGAVAPRAPMALAAPRPGTGLVGLVVQAGLGDYRAGDQLWCERLAPEGFARALNRDVLVPRPAGRFAFGRLIGREEGRIQLIGLAAGARQQVLADPPWMARVIRLIRDL